MGAFIENRDFQRRPLGDFYKANLNRLAFFFGLWQVRALSVKPSLICAR